MCTCTCAYVLRDEDSQETSRYDCDQKKKSMHTKKNQKKDKDRRKKKKSHVSHVNEMRN